MVDLGVDVVGAAGQHDALAALLAHPLQGAAPLGAHVGLEGGVLGEARGHGPTGLGQGHVPVGEDLHEPLGQFGGVAQVEEGGQHAHAAGTGVAPAPIAVVADLLDVGADDLGVGGHDRAVEVLVGPGDELALVEDAREPDGLDALVDEGLDVPVGELGRVAHVLTGDGIHTRLEQLVVGTPRDHDPESEPGKDREPQRVVLVHAQHPRNTDLAAGVLAAAQTPVGEGAPVLVVVEVGHVGLGGAPLLGGAALAPVARNVPLAVGEGGDGQLAVVLAQLAHGCLGGQTEAGELGEAHESPGRAVVGESGRQSRAEAAHEAGDVGPHDLASGEQLEGAQNSVVEEGAALDRHVVAELVGIAQLDDLVQGVAHHRVGQARADLTGGGVLLLRLLDRGVHEHGAPGSQIHRTLSPQGRFGELLDGLPHGLGEGLQE